MAFKRYSIANDTATGSLNLSLLKQEIEATDIIWSNIKISGDNIDIDFTGIESTLDAVIAAHDGSNQETGSIFYSPDGSKWELTIDNNGILTTTKL